MNRSLLKSYRGRNVLAIGAHPDDVEMGMGGTAARLVQLGASVTIAVVSVPSNVEERLDEARAACAVLGAGLRVLCSERPCRVEDLRAYELVALLDSLVREHEPAAIFAHGAADHHRDHQLVFEACRASSRLGAMDVYCYQPCACRPGPIAFVPQAFVDIEATLELKMAAVAAHRSQFQARGLDASFLRDVARCYGHAAGVPYAEAFEVRRLALG
jgi:LmbE family N-acetylglucosaminyl deacetylase